MFHAPSSKHPVAARRTTLLTALFALGVGCTLDGPLGDPSGPGSGKADGDTDDPGALFQAYQCAPDGLGIYPDQLTEWDDVGTGELDADRLASLSPLQRDQLWVAVNRVEDYEGQYQQIHAPADDELFSEVVFHDMEGAPRAVRLRHAVDELTGPVDWVLFQSAPDAGFHSIFFYAGTLIMSSWMDPDFGEAATCSFACDLLPEADCEFAFGCALESTPQGVGCTIASWALDALDRAACLSITDEDLCDLYSDTCSWAGACVPK